MTGKKIQFAAKRIEKFKKSSAHIQALILQYHLNIDLIKHILTRYDKSSGENIKKVKLLLKEFSRLYSKNNDLRGILTKNNFKSVKLWMGKMDLFFKTLKMAPPTNTKSLLSETEKVFHILNISTTKTFVKPSEASS
jgi:hypothetical protein